MMISVRNGVAVLLAVTMLGCHTTRQVTMNVNPDASSRPRKVEIQIHSGPRFTVYGPEVRNDSLFGWFDKERTKPAGIPLNEIGSARTREFSFGKTLGLTLGLAALTYIALLILFLTTYADY